jgi:hypothetical protein
MKKFILIAVLGAAAGLSACGTTGMAGDASAFKDLVTDPRCAHHDEAEGITGAAGIPASLHFKVVRDCPAAQLPAPAAAPAT